MKIRIRNGFILDGTGDAPFWGDLVFENNQIVYVGREEKSFIVDREIDVHGMAIAPGFIDAHTHSDMSLAIAPDFQGQIRQGVTTEIMGNCGLSPFPLSEKNHDHLQKMYARYEVPLIWQDFKTYRHFVKTKKIPIRLENLVGHNTLRAAVMGYVDRPAKDQEIDQMKQLLEMALNQGACGLSMGLGYIPGKFCTQKELIAILEPLAKSGKVLTVHLRSEGDELLESFDEIIEIAIASGIQKLHISHLKTALKRNWGKIDELLLRLKTVHRCFSLTADRYPYCEGMSTLSLIAPPPYDRLEDSRLSETLKNVIDFENCLKGLQAKGPLDWHSIRLVNTQLKKYYPYLGHFFSEISLKLKQDPAHICCEILREDAVNAQAAYGGMNPCNMQRIICEKNVCCGSDEQTKTLDGRYGSSHPRYLGSMPTFFQCVREHASIEETVRKMTSLPADIFGLQGRGRLQVGHYADLVIFDPEKFKAHSNFANPHQLATGVLNLFINGTEIPL